MCICLFFPSFSDSLVDSWIHSLSHLPIHSCIHSVSHLLHCPYIHNHSHHYSCTLGTRWSPGGHQVVTRWSPGSSRHVSQPGLELELGTLHISSGHDSRQPGMWKLWQIVGELARRILAIFSVSVFCGLQCISVVYSSWRVIEAERCDWKWTWALIIFLLWKCR